MRRPLLWSLLFYVMGILCANYMTDIFLIILFTALNCILIFVLYKKYKWSKVIIFSVIYIIGFANCLFHNKPKDQLLDNYLKSDLFVTIKGHVKDIQTIKENKINAIIKSNHIYNKNIICDKSVQIQAYLDSEIKIRPGDLVELQGNLFKPSKATNPGQFDDTTYCKNKGISYKFSGKIISTKKVECISSFLFELKLKLCDNFDKLLPSKQSGIVKTMLLGYKSDLDKDVKQLFQQAGIAHVLAISGLHVSILASILFLCLGRLNISKRISAMITIILLVVYCVLTGSSVSTVRATLMTGIVLFSYIIYRTPDIYTSIGCSAFVLLLIQPLSLWDVGFQLSYSAVIGLVIITPLLDKIYFIPKKIRLIISASIAASLSTIPITLFHFYQFPTYSIILNIIVVPLVTLVVLFSIIGGISSFISIILGKFFIGIVYYILLLYELICNITLNIPFSTLVLGKPNLILIVCYYIIIFTVVIICNLRTQPKKKKVKDILLYELLISLSLFLITSNNMLEVNILDVGQGDGIVIHTKKDHTIVVDGGGIASKYPYSSNTGYNILYPFLKYKGIDTIDIMFLTHPHADHIIGLIELLDLVKVKKLYVADAIIEDSYLYNELVDKAKIKKVPIYKISKNQKIKIDSVKLECLWPNKGSEFSNLNDSSMVLGLDYGDIDVLFTGDIEKDAEINIAKYISNYEVLKVAHHGSNTSSTEEFLSSVKPIIGLISCGEKSIYGHPHKKVSERLAKQNINVYNTSIDGAILLKTDGKKITVRRFLN